MLKNRTGFTLIEPMIVFTILFSTFPIILGAPEKGRDTYRIADLQKLQKVMVNAYLEGEDFPTKSVCLDETAFAENAPFNKYLGAFDGTYPKDPSPVAFSVGSVVDCSNYIYYVAPSTDYEFGLYTKVENKRSGNSKCSALEIDPVDITRPTSNDDACYSILSL